ncbi:MAG: hybrid sensor histidine kinase/response regulator [Planctomycetes bacterium]|nr:hybrid sensor histidine kinase/response regulator [Planctomycetota bacterium]
MSRDAETRRKRVLVVDDNSHDRRISVEFLEAEGYAVAQASSGGQAVSQFAEWNPDLVLLDVYMPGMNGFDTCRRLRSLPQGGKVAILFLTAVGQTENLQKAVEAGADDFLLKPVNSVELAIRARSLFRIRELQETLRAAYGQLREEHDALLRAERRRQDLMTFIVHDLKGPLSSVLLSAQVLEGEPQLSTDGRLSARDILIATQSLQRLVLTLLDVSESEEGTLRPRWVEVDIPKLLEESSLALRPRAESRELQVLVSSQPNIGPVRADPDLLGRLLENLLDNACRHSPFRGTLRLEALSLPDGSLDLRVCDQGTGVPEAWREKIFEKYARVESQETPRVRTSRGLGLAFCRMAAEAHGGRILVENEAPNWTVFCVRLPAEGHPAP